MSERPHIKPWTADTTTAEYAVFQRRYRGWSHHGGVEGWRSCLDAYCWAVNNGWDSGRTFARYDTKKPFSPENTIVTENSANNTIETRMAHQWDEFRSWFLDICDNASPEAHKRTIVKVRTGKLWPIVHQGLYPTEDTLPDEPIRKGLPYTRVTHTKKDSRPESGSSRSGYGNNTSHL